MYELKSATVGDWADSIVFTARYYSVPPVLWCPASRCWVEGRPPFAPLDPALWRVRIAGMFSKLAFLAGGQDDAGVDIPLVAPGPDGRDALPWKVMARAVRVAPGPVARDLKEILSGERIFRREAAMTPERWLGACSRSAGAFTSRQDLIAAFRVDSPNAVIGDRAFLVLARELVGRDGRFGPLGARGPWGFRVKLSGTYSIE